MKNVSQFSKLTLAALCLSVVAMADETAANNLWFGWAALGAGFAIALAVVGGTLAQGRIASAYLEGASRNPGATSQMFTPLILGLALVESLVLFGFVIAFQLVGKLAVVAH